MPGGGKRRDGNAPPKQAQRLIEECRELLIEPGGERRRGRVSLGPFAGRRRSPSFPHFPQVRVVDTRFGGPVIHALQRSA
jgi:hypothetical protein